MDKKPYVAPQSLIVELDTVSIISASFDIVANSKDGVDEMGANHRRGEWGDLWSDSRW